jgi:hypothetical protein
MSENQARAHDGTHATWAPSRPTTQPTAAADATLVRSAGEVQQKSTAEKYSSVSGPERAQATRSDPVTSAKTFNDLPATSSQREARDPSSS